MMRLDDITPDAWMPVAERVQAGAVDVWDWRMPAFDAATLRAALDIGRPFLTAQRREPDGRVVLLARRLPRLSPTTPTLPPSRPVPASCLAVGGAS